MMVLGFNLCFYCVIEHKLPFWNSEYLTEVEVLNELIGT